ncbi:HsdM family class I SAM-dependent methyltransferase [Shewanella algae]|uniref:HsdM family class I SAM-dependent methyltransferase n=1 Tax=Shewanella algae TaxID=38313 RepID=UPI003AAA9161
MWEQIRRDLGDPTDHLFTTQKKTGRYAKYVVDKVFGIDFDEKAVRVGRTLNLIAGDGQTNVLHLNTLDYERWFEKTGDNNNPGDRDWQDIYGDGWKRLRKLRTAKNENRDFQFDVLMANPPFAGDIKETRILARYDLARSVSFDKINKVDENDPNIVDATHRNPSFPEALHASHEVIYQLGDGTFRKVKVKNQNKVGRDILFIERNLQFLKPGGRMAVVLPQGRFNNASDKALREYLAEHGRILAVVGLHGNVFKPHTGTKTSVLFIQKWNDDPAVGPLCPKVDDYPIFFATMQEPSKDNSGDKIYRAERHCMSEKQVAEIEKLQAKWLKIDKKEQKLRELEHNDKITAKQQERLTEIDNLRKTSKDELEKVAINLDAPKLDNHGHLIVKHDLFNHDGLTGDGIAEAFCEFAKKEGLSFFR